MDLPYAPYATTDSTPGPLMARVIRSLVSGPMRFGPGRQPHEHIARLWGEETDVLQHPAKQMADDLVALLL
jgi:hypothetical protein